MGIRAVIWDFGGVLVRTEDRTPREQLATRLGLTSSELYNLIFETETARLATIGKVTTQDHWENVRATLGLTRDEFPVVPDYFWGGDRLDTELIEFIRGLRSHYKTGLLSNAWDDLRRMLEEKWRIADAFDAIIISAEVGVAKPDLQIYQIALERLGVAPQEAVFIDDFRHNVEAARAVNMHGIQFQSPGQARAELEQMLKGDHR